MQNAALILSQDTQERIALATKNTSLSTSISLFLFFSLTLLFSCSPALSLSSDLALSLCSLVLRRSLPLFLSFSFCLFFVVMQSFSRRLTLSARALHINHKLPPTQNNHGDRTAHVGGGYAPPKPPEPYHLQHITSSISTVHVAGGAPPEPPPLNLPSF